MPARNAADRLSRLQRLLNQTSFFLVAPTPPTFSAQNLDLHVPHDLKARLKVKSSGDLPNCTRRSSPERYYAGAGVGISPYAAVQAQWFRTPTYSEADLTGG